MAGRQRPVRDRRAGAGQPGGEAGDIVGRHDRIERTRQHQHAGAGEIRRRRIAERLHRPQQHRAGEHAGVGHQHRGGDVGAVGEAERDRRGEVIGPARLGDEAGEFAGPADDVRLVEHAFAQPTEEPRHAVFEHVAARRHQRRAGRQHAADVDQVVLVAAGAVQQQERRAAAVAGHEAVDVGQGLGLSHDGLLAGSPRARRSGRRVRIGPPPRGAGLRAEGEARVVQFTVSGVRSGRTSSMRARWRSRPAGSFSVSPRLATGSSTAKPGSSVAISNSTPPGSRK